MTSRPAPLRRLAVSVFASAALVLGATACGGSDDDGGASSSQAAPSGNEPPGSSQLRSLGGKLGCDSVAPQAPREDSPVYDPQVTAAAECTADGTSYLMLAGQKDVLADTMQKLAVQVKGDVTYVLGPGWAVLPSGTGDGKPTRAQTNHVWRTLGEGEVTTATAAG